MNNGPGQTLALLTYVDSDIIIDWFSQVKSKRSQHNYFSLKETQEQTIKNSLQTESQGGRNKQKKRWKKKSLDKTKRQQQRRLDRIDIHSDKKEKKKINRVQTVTKRRGDEIIKTEEKLKTRRTQKKKKFHKKISTIQQKEKQGNKTSGKK